ncbi:hypothetical protein FJZ31_28825 [Candidatus Poribacteria bacterium]|nr:hypothetical protein [Candidatus Poribacteria bacterium]
MDGFRVNSTDKEIQITVSRSLVDIAAINNLLTRLRVEQLVKKANFTEEVVKVADEIKKSWWEKNKARYMEGPLDGDSH